MKTIKIQGKATLAELQQQIDDLEQQLQDLPTKYPNPIRLNRLFDYEEEVFTN